MSRKDNRRKQREFKKAPVQKANSTFLIIFGIVTVAFLALMIVIINNSDGVRINKDPFNGVNLPRVASFITSGCEQCDASVEVLEQLQKDYEGRIVLKTFDATKDGIFLTKYGISQAPSQVLIDQNGNVLGSSQGSHFTRQDILSSMVTAFGIAVDFTEFEGMEGYEVLGNIDQSTSTPSEDEISSE